MAAVENLLETVFSDAGIDPHLATPLIAAGWSVNTFRDVVGSVADFTDQLFDDLCPNENLTLLQKASIRSAWRSLQNAEASNSTAQGSGLPSSVVSMAPDGSWTEAFPPKLNSSRLRS
jgi:hypothetical protein